MEGDGDGKLVSGVQGEGMREEGFGPGESEICG